MVDVDVRELLYYANVVVWGFVAVVLVLAR